MSRAASVNLTFAALAMVATLPGRTQGLGLITEPLIAALQLDRLEYASINFWATLIGAAFCIPFGRWMDRLGPRITLTFTLLALGATVIAMSNATSAANLWLTVTLTRGLGQSALSVLSIALVGKWFSERINFAMGVYSLLVGIGFIAAFPSVGAAVLAHGWRTAWLALGVAVLALGPLAWLLVRERPALVQQSETSAASMTLAEALRTPAFWIFALASSVFGLVYSGIALFNQSILEQRGFDASAYHQVLVVSTMLGLAANFGGGWLATRWPIQRVMGIAMALLAVAVLMLPLVRRVPELMLYAATMGIAGGVVTVVFFSVWPQVFGRTHLGRIQGFAQMMTVLASATGPVLLAQTLKSTGSYESIFYTLALVVAVLAVGCWTVALPKPALSELAAT